MPDFSFVPRADELETPDLRKRSKVGGQIDRAVKSRQKRNAHAKSKRQADMDAAKADKPVRYQSFLLDNRRCRAYGTPLLFETDNVLKLAHCHHIKFKSAGGGDELSNRVTLGPVAHRKVHEGELDMTGDRFAVLTFTEYEFRGGTRRIVRTWESPCPKAGQ